MGNARNPLLARLAAGEVLVADGAMGTLLLQRGLEPGQCPEALNLTRSDVLENVARLYLEAGADIIQTNTFGASSLKLAQYGLKESADEINRRAVRAVRKAAGDSAYVSGSCGPTGRLLEPYGDTAPEMLYEAFLAQMRALICEGVDVICVETMVDLSEAKLALRAAREVSPETPVMVSMTFDATPRGFFTIMGHDVAQSAESLAYAGADGVGSNCGNGIENMVKIAALFRAACNLPIIIQPNAGLPQTRDGKTMYTETPEFMASKVPQFIDAGVSIIGGCCGTTPHHTAAVRAQIDSPHTRRVS